ncbi:hypothetical protein VTK73DRAFT_3293 [Phialemonium thermophilum]|uniref:C2H2-type domain-containing protein n=1 Tax=Phialemonium thermophilum TaxID=223376 RepID=A0ABR3Y147_9PEZI
MLLNQSYHPVSSLSSGQQQQLHPQQTQQHQKQENGNTRAAPCSQLFLPESPYQQGSPYLSESDFDLDLSAKSDSLSSSPLSARSLFSQYAGAPAESLSSFDGDLVTADSISNRSQQKQQQHSPLWKLPASAYQQGFGATDDEQPSLFVDNGDLMHGDWYPGLQLHSRPTAQNSHNRESSLSSLGSTGPASPYSHNTSNPRIVADTLGDDFHGFSGQDDSQSQFVKSLPSSMQDAFYANYPNYAPVDTMANSTHTNLPVAQRPRNDRNLLPPPDFPAGQNRSRPVSVASSIVSDSPATPSGDLSEDKRQINDFSAVPKLERTMTDVFNDELYNPNFTITSPPSGHVAVSPTNEMFAQRLQAANNQHLNAAQSPAMAAVAREKSPFRHGSPFAPPTGPAPVGFGSAQQLREQQKAVRDAQALQQQMARRSDMGTPQTISPKDAVLEFHSPEGDANFPLFPQQNTNGEFDTTNLKGLPEVTPSFDGLQYDPSSFNHYVAQQMPSNLQVPQHYPFIPQQQQASRPSSMSSGSMAQSRLGSDESGQRESTQSNSSPQRPAATSADGGTYTCTYHGCTQRFETPALLQKHKREGHRQAHGIGHRRTDNSAAGMAFGSQAGPHICERINPSTGKPCNTVFSRPYDLTRHEDTIHNARKQKVRCNLCTDEKTFSRADALTRHYRVCHPDVEFPGKHRRKGAQAAV